MICNNCGWVFSYFNNREYWEDKEETYCSEKCLDSWNKYTLEKNDSK